MQQDRQPTLIFHTQQYLDLLDATSRVVLRLPVNRGNGVGPLKLTIIANRKYTLQPVLLMEDEALGG